jgi:DNA replication initiation complex subunit (GINS family)
MIFKSKNSKTISILVICVFIHFCGLSSLSLDTNLTDDYDNDDDDYDENNVESKEFIDQMHKEVAYIYFDRLMHKLVNWLKVKLESDANVSLTSNEEQIFNTVYLYLSHMKKEMKKKRFETSLFIRKFLN